jgi:hypothetical protein
LPTLAALILVALIVWRGEGWIRRTSAAIAAPFKRVIAGPDYPKSAHPQVFAGTLTRKVLRLRENLAVRATPGGWETATFRARGFSDLFDVWPRRGAPTHYRVGNENLTGWVEADDVIPWDTRLAVRLGAGPTELRAGASGGLATRVESPGGVFPVLAWEDGAIKIAVWDAGLPWSKLAGIGWISAEQVPGNVWAALLTDAEIVAARRAARRAEKSTESLRVRMRTLLGLLLTDQRLSDDDLAAVRAVMPARVVSLLEAPRPGDESLIPTDAAASWSGLSFRALPLVALP